VQVAADEVGEEEEEEDGDYCVADSGAGLGRECVSFGVLVGFGGCLDLRLTTTSCRFLRCSSLRSRSRSMCCRRRRDR
jgi:hypothetical protein